MPFRGVRRFQVLSAFRRKFSVITILRLQDSLLFVVVLLYWYLGIFIFEAQLQFGRVVDRF